MFTGTEYWCRFIILEDTGSTTLLFGTGMDCRSAVLLCAFADSHSDNDDDHDGGDDADDAPYVKI
jgi:hypothetical protein